jgi:hypothetical protein
MPPACDIASDPLPALPGIPTFVPGCMDITTPDEVAFPPPPLGAATPEASAANAPPA